MRPENASVELVRAALERGRRRLLGPRSPARGRRSGRAWLRQASLLAPLSTRSAVILVALAIGTTAVLICDSTAITDDEPRRDPD